MTDLDQAAERLSRRLAGAVSRRSLLRSLGGSPAGAASPPLLPVARGAAPSATGKAQDPGDPASCDYWRYCAIDGFLRLLRGVRDGLPARYRAGADHLEAPAAIPPTGATTSFRTIAAARPRAGVACATAIKATARSTGRRSQTTTTGAGSKSNIPYHCTVSRIVGVADKAGSARGAARFSPSFSSRAAPSPNANRARQNYLIHCMGCHGKRAAFSRSSAFVQTDAGEGRHTSPQGRDATPCVSRASPRRPWTMPRRPGPELGVGRVQQCGGGAAGGAVHCRRGRAFAAAPLARSDRGAGSRSQGG